MTASVASRLPLGQLLVLAFAGFLTMLTETVPAGLLPRISVGLGASDSTGGQLLTAYAAASTVAAIPLVKWTAQRSRKRVIVATVIVVALANLAIGLAPTFAVAVAARVIGGAAAALQWAVLAGFAMRLVAPQAQGRALSISMAGIPLALAVGVPTGTAIGQIMSWREVFVALGVVGFMLAVWASVTVPDITPTDGGGPAGLKAVFTIRGLVPVFAGAGLFQLGDMLLYTYVAPFLRHANDRASVTGFLLVLGLAAMVGLFATGSRIDSSLPGVAFASMGLFSVGMLMCAVFTAAAGLYLSAAAWGLGLGAAPTVFQTACARVAGPLIDQAQSLLVTIFNAGMALGSAIGGAVLAASGAGPLPLLSLLVFGAILVMLSLTRRSSLPASAASFE